MQVRDKLEQGRSNISQQCLEWSWRLTHKNSITLQSAAFTFIIKNKTFIWHRCPINRCRSVVIENKSAEFAVSGKFGSR